MKTFFFITLLLSVGASNVLARNQDKISNSNANSKHLDYVIETYKPEMMCYGEVRHFDGMFIQDFVAASTSVYRFTVYSFTDQYGFAISITPLPASMKLNSVKQVITCEYVSGESQIEEK